MAYQWIGFSGTLAATHLASLGIDRAHPLLSAADGSYVGRCMDQMVKLGHGSSLDWQSSPSSEFLRKSLLYEFLHQLTLSRPEPAPDRNREYVQEAVRFIQGNHARHLSMEETAAWLGLSRKYLSALFKKTMGQSPKSYLCQYRLSVAQRFLGEAAMTIKEVAFSAGFGDELYFSRLFKKVYGQSPSEYRQASKSGAL
jgi:AraC-like DNA-binding protein